MTPGQLIRVKSGRDNVVAKFLAVSGKYLVVQKRNTGRDGWTAPIRIHPSEVATEEFTSIRGNHKNAGGVGKVRKPRR